MADRHEGQSGAGHGQRSHAAGPRPLVAVEAVGIVIGGGRKDDRAAVADRLDRELGPGDPLLDEHRVSGRRPRQQLARVTTCGVVVCQVRSHYLDPLAAGEARGLDRHRRLAEGLERRFELTLAAHDAQRRDRLRRHLRQQLAREGLVPLDLGARARRSNRPRALRQQRVDDAGRERLIGTDHRQIDLALAREGRHGGGVAHVAQRIAASRRHGLAHDRRIGMADEGMQLAVLGHPHGKRALASSVPDDHGPHGRSARPAAARPASRSM